MNKSSTTLILNEVKTLTYVIPLVFCALAAIISLVLFWPLGTILAILCILLSLIETGLEFDHKTMEYRKFKSLFGCTWGSWIQIKDPDGFHLHLSVESVTYQRVIQGTGPSFYGGLTASSKSITYDIVYLTQTDSWITIYEFSSYKMALKLVKQLRELESIEVVDHIALKLEENHQKRLNRRR